MPHGRSLPTSESAYSGPATDARRVRPFVPSPTRCTDRSCHWLRNLGAAAPALSAPPKATSPQPAPTVPSAREAIEYFESRIRPLLIQNCYECHSARAKDLQGGLRLDSREAIRKGGESGPALVPGDVEGSLLIRALRYEDHEMPPKGKLPAAVIAEFEHWVKIGGAGSARSPRFRDSDADDRQGAGHRLRSRPPALGLPADSQAVAAGR